MTAAEREAWDRVYEASERGEETIAGLPPQVEPGTYSAVFARGGKVLDLELAWSDQGFFTYSIDETFFDAPYHGWGHWSDGEMLVTWFGGHLHGDAGHTATLVEGVDDEDEAGPQRPEWWHRLFIRIMDAMDSPEAERTIGHEGAGARSNLLSLVGRMPNGEDVCPDCGCKFTGAEPHSGDCVFCEECEHICPEGLMGYGDPCGCCSGGPQPVGRNCCDT